MITALFLTAAIAGQPQTSDQQQAIADACLSPAEQALDVDEITGERRREAIACITGHVAKLVNADLPQQLDEYTTLVSVEAEGVNLIYNNRVEFDAGNVAKAERETISASVRGYVCSQTDMSMMISLGASYTYVWTDRAGKPIHRLLITDC